MKKPSSKIPLVDTRVSEVFKEWPGWMVFVGGLQTNAENHQEQSNNYERGNSATHIYQAAMQGQIALCRCMLFLD